MEKNINKEQLQSAVEAYFQSKNEYLAQLQVLRQLWASGSFQVLLEAKLKEAKSIGLSEEEAYDFVVGFFMDQPIENYSDLELVKRSQFVGDSTLDKFFKKVDFKRYVLDYAKAFLRKDRNLNKKYGVWAKSEENIPEELCRALSLTVGRGGEQLELPPTHLYNSNLNPQTPTEIYEAKHTHNPFRYRDEANYQQTLGLKLDEIIESLETREPAKKARKIVYALALQDIRDKLYRGEEVFQPSGKLKLSQEFDRYAKAVKRDKRTIRTYVRQLEPYLDGLRSEKPAKYKYRLPTMEETWNFRKSWAAIAKQGERGEG